MPAKLKYPQRREVLRQYSDGANPYDLATQFDVLVSTITGWARALGIRQGECVSDAELDEKLSIWRDSEPDEPEPSPLQLAVVHEVGPPDRTVAASGEMETFREGLLAHSENSRATMPAGGTEAERAATLVKGIAEIMLARALEVGLPVLSQPKDVNDMMKTLLKVHGVTNKAGRNTNGIDLSVLNGPAKPAKVIDV